MVVVGGAGDRRRRRARRRSPRPVRIGSSKDAKDQESYVKVPMPAGIQVIETELEGPVFATAEGKTIYTWPLGNLRNGNAGDRRNSGVSTCDDTIYKETTGYMSPYPPGFLLPELETRKSCEQLWPAVLAPADAKPVGKWTVVKRKNGQTPVGVRRLSGVHLRASIRRRAMCTVAPMR